MLTSTKDFRKKLIIYFVLLGTIIISLGTYRNIYYINKFSNKEYTNKVKFDAQTKYNFFSEYVLNVKNTILALVNNSGFKNDILLKKDNFIKNSFKMIMDSNKDFMQIRYIDLNGNEVIKIARDEVSGKTYFTPKEKLQNKKDRYYFSENISLDKNYVWFSKIDLNMEFGKIEKPIKPVLRAITPIYFKNKIDGFIVINIFMKQFLEQLADSKVFDIYLIDNMGNFLIHKNREHSWSEYLDRNYNLYSEFGSEIGNKILNIENSNFISKKIFIQNLTILGSNELKIIFIQNEDYISQNKLASQQLGLFIAFVGIVFSFILGYFLSKPFDRLYKELENLTLSLESRVKNEINNNREKEQILLHQSKLASMGEMIGNIAHQWRQPLTRISLILQNTTGAFENGKFDKEYLEKINTSVKKQIDYMSNTIDEFRNFFNPNKEKSLFFIKDCINEALKLEDATLRHNRIDIDFKVIDNIQIYSYRGELSQVVLNILNNAKDIFIERDIVFRKVIISLYIKNNKFVISILDNGEGVDDKIIHKIFEPYFSTKFQTQGTGIGLYMSKIIVEKHMEGELTVLNNKDGAEFKIILPIE